MEEEGRERPPRKFLDPPEVAKFSSLLCTTMRRQNDQSESVGGGHTYGAKRRNFFFVHLRFLALQVQLIASVSAFVMVSTVWSV